MKRQWSLQTEQTKAEFNNSIWLWLYKTEVRECNLLHLNRMDLPVCYIRAEDNFVSKPEDNLDNENLEKELQLSIGSRVILRYNLNVRAGLVNGSIGIVTNIVFKNNRRPPLQSPELILMQFPDSKIQTDVPIQMITRSWKCGNSTRTRKQFPLVLAYALTLHKS